MVNDIHVTTGKLQTVVLTIDDHDDTNFVIEIDALSIVDVKDHPRWPGPSSLFLLSHVFARSRSLFDRAFNGEEEVVERSNGHVHQ